MLVTGITQEEFNDLPHTRWSVRGSKEVKIYGAIVAIMDKGVCSVKWCHTIREAKRVFSEWLYS